MSTVAGDNRSPNVTGHTTDRTVALNVMQNEFTSRKNVSSHSPGTALTGTRSDNKKGISLDAPEIMNSDLFGEESMQPQPADWARVLDAATQRRKEVLMPENLENMWTIGRNYKKKVQKIAAGGLQAPVAKGLVTNTSEARKNSGKEMPTSRPVISSATDDKSLVQLPARLQTETRIGDGKSNALHLSHDLNKEQSVVGVHLDELEDTTSFTAIGNKSGLKRSNSTSALKIQPNVKKAFTGEDGGSIISEFYSPDFGRHNNVPTVKSASDKVFCSEGVHNPKLRCRVNFPSTLLLFQ